MLSDNTMKREATDVPTGPISWWSWRPGMKPAYALLLGTPLTILALLLTLLGAITLIAGIEDSFSPPLQVPGTVVGRGTTTSQPQLTLHLKGSAGIPDRVTLAVPTDLARNMSLNASVVVSYSPRLHFAYALEYAGRRYAVPGVVAAGNPPGSMVFLLLGLLLLPYSALLVHWGWRDLLIERYDRGRLGTMTARVVAMRETTRSRQPGFAGRGARLWYGIALLPIEEITNQKIYTFSISEETYRSIRRGTTIKVIYSPHLHHVYTVTKTQ
jgi:hypothetical protein